MEHGRFAGQANSAVTARYGDTMVLVTVVASSLAQDIGYFPLFVEYVERLYAGGKIKGSRWVKREGRPSDDDILAARLIDRSIRPLFPKDYKKEVQVIATVLSVDGENDPAILAMVGASAALATSNIPWQGPVGPLRVGMRNGTFFANPVDSELAFSDLDLVLCVKGESVIMVEAGARQVPEEKVLAAVEFGTGEAQKIIEGIEKLAKKVGTKPEKVEKPKDQELVSLVLKKFGKQIEDYAKSTTKDGGNFEELLEAIREEIGEEKESSAKSAFENVLRQKIRELTLTGKRLDGRRHDEIREISGAVGVLPRTHGSAEFVRGQTQVLTATTLGSPSLEQLIESAEGEETKRYMHHYSMPPFSVGETGRIGFPSRREIGHGALAERALLPVIPSEERFPYTIRVVSEVLSSNGSTSMASTCGSTMSLMDAGAPIAAPVSGIAMGLVVEGERMAILSDITGIEDGAGDMDFKVAGTRDGVTAIQLDVKTQDLTLDILKEALKQAREGRLHILEKMLEVIPEPREKISEYAPKIAVVKVPTEKIGEVIGPGGRVIRKIMADTGATVDVEDDGSVTISGIEQEAVQRAKERVEGLVKEVSPGEIYEGLVKRIQPFGAFVEVLPGKEGLVHISDMAEEFVKDPADLVKIGDKVKVRVKEIDDLGRINLSMLLEGDKKREPRSGDDQRRGYRGGRPRAEERHGRREYRGRASEDRQDRRGKAPHFPASRYLGPQKRKF